MVALGGGSGAHAPAHRGAGPAFADRDRGARFPVRGIRIAGTAGLGLPFEPGVLAVTDHQRATFESLGCIVENDQPAMGEADAIFKGLSTYIDWMKSCYYVSALGLPALSAVGRHHDDFGVLRLGYAFEQATGFGHRRADASLTA